jgi:hypothetical protein
VNVQYKRTFWTLSYCQPDAAHLLRLVQIQICNLYAQFTVDTASLYKLQHLALPLTAVSPTYYVCSDFPRSRVLLEKITVAQLLMKFSLSFTEVKGAFQE